jgi:deazaflavin-dependent oxidoreductase (nitroreductase family)
MTTQPLHHELARYRTIDLTTTGRRSGRPTRIEIWWFHVDGRFIITGTPGKRDWLANVKADPKIVIHSPLGDHPGTAVVVDDVEFRRRVFTDPEIGWYRSQAELDRLVAKAPMIEIDIH